MRQLLLPAAMILVSSSTARATEALFFNGGGYNIEILIGYDDHPVIAQILFTPPGATSWVSIPASLLQIDKFEIKKRILFLHFTNPSNTDLPGSFSLSVKKNTAILSIDGKRIKTPFDWTM
jgi:hypothetical protein